MGCSNPSNSVIAKSKKRAGMPTKSGVPALCYTSANCKIQAQIVTKKGKSCHANGHIKPRCHAARLNHDFIHIFVSTNGSKVGGIWLEGELVGKSLQLSCHDISVTISVAIPCRADSISISCWYIRVRVYIVDQPPATWICFWVYPHCII